jgi:uncharacterized membrane protein/glutaredoxin
MATATVSPPARRARRRRHSAAPPLRRDLLLVGAALVGLLVSAYLAVVDLTGGSALCLAGSDCDIVRASSYGQLAGLPVAVLGVVYFAAVLGAALWLAPWPQRQLPLLGGIGLGAALAFVVLQGLVLRAWCPYCLVADAAALAVGIRTLWPWAGRRGPNGAAARGVVGAVLAVAVLMGGYALGSPSAAGSDRTGTAGTGSSAGATATSMSADRLAALADHLRESGATFYGAYWCPHCQTQKQMFGAAASRLPYVECDPRGTNAQPNACQAAGVRAYPTWIIGGQKLEGEVSPSELARLSGFGG